MTDDREVFRVRREAGLRARHETRERRAIRREVAEEIAAALLDHPGPDPSPASPAWWDGYVEAQRDMARIAREIGSKETP
jgi:hypothetical protein